MPDRVILQIAASGLFIAMVVGRTFAWSNRRLARDFEASIALAEAFLYAASVMLLRRRSARCA